MIKFLFLLDCSFFIYVELLVNKIFLEGSRIIDKRFGIRS